MDKTFPENIKDIRTAVMASEVREGLAQGMEYVEQFASTATTKAAEAAASAAAAAKSAENASTAVSAAIDPTLSVSGKAADAAKVGEAVNAEAERAKGVESQIKEDLFDYENIIATGELSWRKGCYDLKTGAFTSRENVAYYCTQKIVTSQFPLATEQGYVTGTSCYSLWNNNIYVGYYRNNKYHQPDETIVDEIKFNIVAVNLAADSKYKPYQKYKLKTLSNTNSAVLDLYNDFNLDFKPGYYKSNSGFWFDDSIYYTSKKLPFNYLPDFITNNEIFKSNSKNIISLFTDYDYSGYYLNGILHNPDGSVDNSIKFTSISISLYKDVDFTKMVLKSVYAQINEKNNIETEDKLKKLTVGVLGDSITYGVGASDRDTTSYVSLLKNDFKTVTNYGISGALIEKLSPYSCMCETYTTMSDNLDVVIVFGGTNDWYFGQQWGDTDSSDISTFMGALNVLTSGLIEKYTGKQIFFVTPMSSSYGGKNTDNANKAGKTMLDYRNAIIERCTYHSIPVIDLYAMSGMDVAHNATHKTYFSSDGVHPNDAGHKRVHDRIVTFIANILL